MLLGCVPHLPADARQWQCSHLMHTPATKTPQCIDLGASLCPRPDEWAIPPPPEHLELPPPRRHCSTRFSSSLHRRSACMSS